MSRIGKKPITVPSGVKIAVKDGICNIEGPKGKLQQKLFSEIEVKQGASTDELWKAFCKKVPSGVKNLKVTYAPHYATPLEGTYKNIPSLTKAVFSATIPSFCISAYCPKCFFTSSGYNSAAF